MIPGKVMPEKKQLLVPALEYQGERFNGFNHGDAHEQLVAVHPEARHVEDFKYGWRVNGEGELLSRDEATAIADGNDLIKEERRAGAYERGLRTEDLK